MGDPRAADSQVPGSGTLQPWLAVNGSYDSYLDSPSGYSQSVYRSVNVSGGLSATKSFHRTSLIFGYGGSGSDYLGRSAGVQSDWRSSNVGALAVSTQATRRLTLDLSEVGGAANGGFGAAAAGLQSGGLGVLGSMGVAGRFLFGGGAVPGGSTNGPDPLQNNLVDADYYLQMSYFSSTSANAGILLTNRTMLNFGGSASFVRRDGRGYSDANSLNANATLSTQLSRRFSVFLGYSFDKIEFVQSIGDTYIQGGFAGMRYRLAPHDEVSLSVNDSYVDTKFVTTIALPPDIAALLGVASITSVNGSSRSYLGGRLSYTHSFQHGGFNIACNSMIAPGNDLILLARSEGCTVSLSRSLTPRFSVTGIGGLRRLNGMSQAGSRYDIANGGLVFAYRIFRGVSFTTGANYRAAEIKPSSQQTTDVVATAGLYWSPREGVHIF